MLIRAHMDPRGNLRVFCLYIVANCDTIKMMSELNVLDIILFVFFVIAGIAGAKKGFLEDFSQKAGYFFGFLVAIAFTKILTGYVENTFSIPLWLSAALAYIILYLAGYLLIKYISSVLRSVLKSNFSAFFDSLLGFVLKFAEFVFLACVVVRLLYYQNLFDLKPVIESSFICSKVLFRVINIK